MKTANYRIISLCILMLALFVSCNKDDNDNEVNDYYMTAMVDDANWSASDVSATYNGDNISITGLVSSNEHIILIIYQPETGTFDFGVTISTLATYTPQGGFAYTTTNNGTGNVEIIEFNTEEKIIRGKFSFVAGNGTGDQVVITDGRFKTTW